MSKRFVSAYRGSAEYVVDGVSYEVRSFGEPGGPWAVGYWPFITSEVGTVRAKHWPEFESFPPAAVLAEFPGYVGARCVRASTEDSYRLEYLGGEAPDLVWVPGLAWFEPRWSAALKDTADISGTVALYHSALYPHGCPLMCEACSARAAGL